MGCGSSRFDGSGLALPVKARASFLRRLEQRRNSQTPSSTLSKKELLLHDKEDEGSNAASGHDQPRISDVGAKSTCLQEGDNESCVTSEGSEKLMKYSSDKHGKDVGVNKDDKLGEEANDQVQHERKSVGMGANENAKIEESVICDSENDEDDDLDERMLRQKEDELGFPGSPSFRVFFKDDKSEENRDEANIPSITAIKDSPADTTKVDSLVSPKVESGIPEEKKEKRRRSFKKVIPRGGQTAMKNLLNVRSCMSSSPSSNHDQTHLLTPKTPA